MHIHTPTCSHTYLHTNNDTIIHYVRIMLFLSSLPLKSEVRLALILGIIFFPSLSLFSIPQTWTFSC